MFSVQCSVLVLIDVVSSEQDKNENEKELFVVVYCGSSMRFRLIGCRYQKSKQNSYVIVMSSSTHMHIVRNLSNYFLLTPLYYVCRDLLP